MNDAAASIVVDGPTRLRTAPLPGTRWLEHVHVWQPTDPDVLTTGEHETAVILLHGTFDLVGGGTAWPARGARKDEFSGRPMAVYLPPRTLFQVGNGAGEILLIAARQPVRPAPTGRDALAQKPLLPLAGSGKAYDPHTGEWQPAETFPSSPESLPPRRFERIDVAVRWQEQVTTTVLERVFAPDYKAATLSVDEVVLQERRTLRLRDVPRRPTCDEVLVFVRSECEAHVGTETRITKVRGDVVFVLTPDQLETHSVTALDGRAYVAIAYAGKPGSGS